MIRTTVAALAMFLAGCASTGGPAPGPLEQVVDVGYQDAYRTIARQFEACYRVRGIFGNGYDVLADLDPTTQMGRVEVFSIGLTGARDSKLDRVVTVLGDGPRSRILTTGASAAWVERTHEAIGRWLAGDRRC